MGPFCFRFTKEICTAEKCNAEEKAKKLVIREAAKAKCVEFMKDAERMDFLGSGTFGEVRIIILRQIIKLKKPSQLFVQKIYKRIEDDLCGIKDEVINSCLFNSQYIPKLIYCGYDLDGTWCTIMEYYGGGTLRHHIKEEIIRKHQKRDPKINRNNKKFIAYHLSLAIEYLQGLKFVHG